jgi:shikimate kinase
VDRPQVSGAQPAEESDRAGRLKALAARLTLDRAVVLVGMPGAGKTTMGRRLAKLLDMPFVDADEEISRAAGGLSVSEIFSERGEDEFRRLERLVIARLLKDNPPHVLATGGGAFMNAETRAAMREGAITIWLRADFDLLLSRVKRKRKSRPLLDADPGGGLRRLMAERQPVYATADFTVESRNGPPAKTVEAMLQALRTRIVTEGAVS